MTTTYRVDLASIDRARFKVVEEGGETLVIPLKDNYRWEDDELHLRSLVLDARGHVVSAGFPKFFNYGEHPEHDRALAEAMTRGAVEFPEKLDGSLLVGDRIHGAARLRTRGRRVLGEFAADVEPMVALRYPRLTEFLRHDPLLDEHSLLFEFVSPARAVVLRYEEPRLHLLGAVSKRTLAPRWDAAMMSHVARATAVEAAPVHPLPGDLDAALAHVRGWKGVEGVVARFHTADGAPRLLKIKTSDYLRLHAYRTRLGGTRSLKIAWLLDLRDASEILPRLARYGLDWEAAEFARAEVEPYLARRRDAHARLDAFREVVSPWLGSRDKSEKRGYVERVRALTASDPRFAEPWWFTVAIKLFDASLDEALLVVDAAVLDEHPPTLRAWRKDADAEIRAALTAPVREDDG
jgi:hypothetical protein